MVRLYEIGLEMTLETREEVGVAAIVEKTVENRLRWFGYVECWLCSKEGRPDGGQSNH